LASPSNRPPAVLCAQLVLRNRAQHAARVARSGLSEFGEEKIEEDDVPDVTALGLSTDVAWLLSQLHWAASSISVATISQPSREHASRCPFTLGCMFVLFVAAVDNRLDTESLPDSVDHEPDAALLGSSTPVSAIPEFSDPLSLLLPRCMIAMLRQDGPLHFMTVFNSMFYESADVVWTARMRSHLLAEVRGHLEHACQWLSLPISVRSCWNLVNVVFA
jgi:hypothetical protein